MVGQFVTGRRADLVKVPDCSGGAAPSTRVVGAREFERSVAGWAALPRRQRRASQYCSDSLRASVTDVSSALMLLVPPLNSATIDRFGC
jgi:hypothetical protein